MNPFIAQIMMFGGNFAPRGWAFCNGQLLAIASNNALFSLIGTTYGGDGRTTFALPDLRGRAPIHTGTGPGLTPRQCGERGGQEYVVLTQNQIPSHSHAAAGHTGIVVSNQPGTSSEPISGGSISAVGAPRGKVSDALIYNEITPNVALFSDPTAANTKVTIGNTGGSREHYNVQPFLAVNYIIALVGTYPSRS